MDSEILYSVYNVCVHFRKLVSIIYATYYRNIKQNVLFHSFYASCKTNYNFTYKFELAVIYEKNINELFFKEIIEKCEYFPKIWLFIILFHI